MNHRRFSYAAPENLPVGHWAMTTIVVVVRDIYLYYYYRYFISHSKISHGILPAMPTGCCVIMPSMVASSSKRPKPSIQNGEG